MLGWRVAIVRTRQLELAAVEVEESVLAAPDLCDDVISYWQDEFDRPVVLLDPDTRRTHGRGTIADAIVGLDPATFAWWRLSIAAPSRVVGMRRDISQLPARWYSPARPTLDLLARPAK